MSNGRLAAIYARVSGPGQADGPSLDTQVKSCTAKAQALGYEIRPDLVFKEVYTGTELWDRPKLTDLRKLARDGVISAVFCHDLDRLSRGNPVHQLILVDEFERCGIAVEVILNPLDNSDEGKLLQHVKGFAAKMELERIKERTLRGKRAKVQGGRLIRARPLYGYVTTKEGQREIIPDQAAIVRRVFAWAAEGVAIREIKRRLTQEGVPSPTGKPYWAGSTISRILHEEAYRGLTFAWKTRKERGGPKRRPKSEWIRLPDGTTPSLVDPETWEAAQARLRRNKELSIRGAKHPEDYLLRGYVFCGHCRCRMWGVQHKRPWGVETAYRCRGRSGHVGSTCERGIGLPWISAKDLDEWVWEQISELLAQPEVVAQEVRRREEEGAANDGLEVVEQAIRKVEREERNLLSALKRLEGETEQSSLDTQELILSEVKALQKQRRRLEQERDQILGKREVQECRKEQLRDLVGWCHHVAERLEELDFEGKRLALEALDVRVHVYRADHASRAELKAQVPFQSNVCTSLTSPGDGRKTLALQWSMPSRADVRQASQSQRPRRQSSEAVWRSQGDGCLGDSRGERLVW